MKLKKIIAKEFLYFISTALLVTIVFAGLKLYNIYQERKITQITNDLKLLNSNYKKFLSRPLKVKNEKITQEKLYNFVNYVITNPNATKKNIYDNITELNNDSLLLQALYDYGATSQANVSPPPTPSSF